MEKQAHETETDRARLTGVKEAKESFVSGEIIRAEA